MNLKSHNITLSRDASNAIKGLLILLIALGHNSILVKTWVSCDDVSKLCDYNQ